MVTILPLGWFSWVSVYREWGCGFSHWLTFFYFICFLNVDWLVITYFTHLFTFSFIHLFIQLFVHYYYCYSFLILLFYMYIYYFSLIWFIFICSVFIHSHSFSFIHSFILFHSFVRFYKKNYCNIIWTFRRLHVLLWDCR